MSAALPGPKEEPVARKIVSSVDLGLSASPLLPLLSQLRDSRATFARFGVVVDVVVSYHPSCKDRYPTPNLLVLVRQCNATGFSTPCLVC